MSDLSRITRLSGWLQALASVLLVLLPLMVAAYLLRGWLYPATILAQFPGVTTEVTPLSATAVVLIGAVSLPPLLIVLDQMRRLFALYRRGQILSDACAGHILRIGQMMAALAVLGVVLPTMQMLVLSWSNPPGQRILQIGIGQDSLGFLVAGGLLIVIGWVMREAALVKSENESFV